MDTGTKLKEILKKENISAYRVSKDLNINQSYLSKILKNAINPSVNWLEIVFDYLGYSIEFKKKGGDKKRKKKK